MEQEDELGRRDALLLSAREATQLREQLLGIAQVLTNLLTNALQYSPAGTPIRVDSRGEAGAVLLTVRNEGPPIPAELLPTLFEPMKRGTREGSERRSIGLGLFIVDQIVRAHGGTLEVSSTAEAGTAFRVVLPRDGQE